MSPHRSRWPRRPRPPSSRPCRGAGSGPAEPPCPRTSPAVNTQLIIARGDYDLQTSSMTKVSGTAPKADFLTALAKVELRPSMRHTTAASLSSQLSSLGQTHKCLKLSSLTSYWSSPYWSGSVENIARLVVRAANQLQFPGSQGGSSWCCCSCGCAGCSCWGCGGGVT